MAVTSKGTKRKRVATTFEMAYEMFDAIYNVPNWTELQPKKTSRTYWQSQTTAPYIRHLLYRRIGANDWFPTGSFDNCRYGHSSNKTHEQRSAIMKQLAFHVPYEQRQKHWIEARAIELFMEEVNTFVHVQQLAPVRFKFVPDGLKTDVLVQMANTEQPALWIPLQVKSCTVTARSHIRFGRTRGYNMPVLCLALSTDRKSIVARLLFKDTLAQRYEGTAATLNMQSQDPVVEQAKMPLDSIYQFLAAFPLDKMRTRNFCVYGEGQAAPLAARGLKVQQFLENILGYEVESPLEQETAVDAILVVDNRRIMVSFKLASVEKGYLYFSTCAAPGHENVQLMIVGIRDSSGDVTSLAVMHASEVDWDLTKYMWSARRLFAGITGITSCQHLLDVIRAYVPAQ